MTIFDQNAAEFSTHRSMRHRLLFALAFLTCVAVFVYPRSKREDPAPPSPPPPALVQTVALDDFGIEARAFSVQSGRIRRNETFSDILLPFNVSMAKLARMVDLARPTFDVRQIRAGKPYRIYRDDDSLGTARYLVYEADPVHFVRFDLSDTLRVEAGERPVVVTEKEIGGEITSSLYNSLADAGVNTALAVDLSEVFAWQIDFYRIQKGDAFKVIYEERSVAGKPVGLGRILAARFVHRGRDYDAFFYERNGKSGYYDDEGNSVRKAFLMAPVKYGRISSRFTGRRYHPVQKKFKAHLGTDYAAPTGTPIRATGDGVVEEARYTRYNGKYVKIRHNGTYSTGYLHMSRFAAGIRAGANVQQGQVIGYVGSTGLATGPHVCYRFWKNGRQVNHLRETFPSGEPVSAADRTDFLALRDSILSRLSVTPELPGALFRQTAAP